MKRTNHFQILLGLVVGAAAGVGANFLTSIYPSLIPPINIFTTYIAEPVGQIFLRLLFMVVVPLVFASLTLGVAHLEIHRLGKIGLKTALYFVTVTAIACFIGLVLVNVFRPGEGFEPQVQAKLLATFQTQAQEAASKAKTAQFGIKTFVDFFPKNPLQSASNGEMIPWIVFTLFFGLGLSMIDKEKTQWLLKPIGALNDVMVKIVGFAMRLAPFAVFCLLFAITFKFGWVILRQLLFYVVLVFSGYIIHLFGVYSILVRTLGKTNPWVFFRKIAPVMVTAFSTSSSNATLPTTIKYTEEELKVSPDIAGFVLPLGATLNMNGTALFEGVAVLFLAQVFGIDLSWSSQLIVLLLAVVAAIGTAGVPGGSIPLLAIVLATVGVPVEGLAIILGVDRILDMGRTVLNVTGDITAALYLSKTKT